MSGDLTRVMVSLGATNLGNVTGRVLEGLQGLDDYPLEIDVVLGAGAFDVDKVRAAVETLSAGGFHTVNYHENVEDMAAMMAATDLAIGAGGTTSWERCCLGLPTIMVENCGEPALCCAKPIGEWRGD